MKRTAMLCAVSALAIVLAAPLAVQGQQTPAEPGVKSQALAAFDSEKFFEELKLRGVSMDQGFDGERFFEKLRLQGVSEEKPLDAEAFFERLKAEGVSMPSNFDAQRFFDDLAARGVVAPAMVATSPGGGPTDAECKAGWQPSGKWDEGLFNRLCQGRM